MILYFPSHASTLLASLVDILPSQVDDYSFLLPQNCHFYTDILGTPERAEGEIPVSAHQGAWNTLELNRRKYIVFRFICLGGFSCIKVKLFVRVKFFGNCDVKSPICVIRILSSNVYVALIRVISTIEHKDNNI